MFPLVPPWTNSSLKIKSHDEKKDFLAHLWIISGCKGTSIQRNSNSDRLISFIGANQNHWGCWIKADSSCSLMSFHFPKGIKSSRWSTFLRWLCVIMWGDEAALHTFPVTDNGAAGWHQLHSHCRHFTGIITMNSSRSLAFDSSQGQKRASQEYRQKERCVCSLVEGGMRYWNKHEGRAEHPEWLHQYVTTFTQRLGMPRPTYQEKMVNLLMKHSYLS